MRRWTPLLAVTLLLSTSCLCVACGSTTHYRTGPHRLLGAWRERQYFLSDRLVLLTVLLQALSFSGLLLALSARGTERKRLERRAEAYFVIIGIAFMFVELALMQRLTLYLGSPLLAASLVLATVHPSSLLRAPDEATRRQETARFTEDLRLVARAVAQAPDAKVARRKDRP